MASKQRPTTTAATHVERPRAVLSGSASTQGASPNASLDTKRQRARNYASAAPPPTGATAQLQDYKTQGIDVVCCCCGWCVGDIDRSTIAELLAVKLREAAAELANDDPADDAPPQHGTADLSHASRPPADQSSSSEIDSNRRRAQVRSLACLLLLLLLFELFHLLLLI
jgi:hypothetical protein